MIEEYENKLLAFIDILGFGKLVLDSDLEMLEGIFNILSEVNKIRDESNNDSDYKSVLEITTFSDSIVISAPITKAHSLVVACAYLQTQLLFLGMASRGGIALNKTYHKSDIVFGSAMIEAYKIESEVAVYPRVVITEEACTKLLPAFKELKIPTDFDGLNYIDFFQYKGVATENGAANDVPMESQEEYLSKFKANIINGLSKTNSIKHRSKWNWLKLKFNEHVSSANYKGKVGAINT